MMKYDRMDAADASLVILSEIHRNAKIITTDREIGEAIRKEVHPCAA
jgi:hypothetical protein